MRKQAHHLLIHFFGNRNIKKENANDKKQAWIIAGSDSSGKAGIQADFLTFKHFNICPITIITAITTQSLSSVNSIFHIPDKHFCNQFQSIEPPIAIKIGMLGKVSQIDILITYLSQHKIEIVLDPVLFSTSGFPLFHGNMKRYIKHLKKIFPYVTLITPNISEAELLTNIKIASFQDIKLASEKLLAMGVKNVLIKGGHFNDEKYSQDYWTNGVESIWLSTKRHDKNVRGTGCTFSSAITACLAKHHDIKDAIVIAKRYISQYIRTDRFNNAVWKEDTNDLPLCSLTPIQDENLSFKPCADRIGLYPVVDSIKWLELLLPLGVRTIQLRIKDKIGEDLENEIAASIILAKKFDAQLFINDYWQYAIKHQAYGVHLGQEDMDSADIQAIKQEGLRLGISTHSHFEIARAHAIKPSYIAFGPIFSTTSKEMNVAPQGLEKLQYWINLLEYPIVAIGGIDQHNFLDVLKTKVDGIAMISAITKAADPIATVNNFLGSWKW